MLKIVTGPFHPALDHALVEDVRALKAGDPFAPLALVVPSASLADYLKRLLAVQSQLPLLNVYVLTLHQFALRLRDDLARRGQSIPTMQLADDFYFEQLLRQVVSRRLPGLEAVNRLPSSPGTWKGLWATVRDLKDAVVDPATALKAVSEGLFEEDDRPWLQALFTLQAAVHEGSRSLTVGSPDDLAASLRQHLPQSIFLSQFARLGFYGFYDLLQVQLSFFESVVRSAPVTLYCPSGASPAYAFSRRVFERHLLPLAQVHEDRSAVSSPDASSPSRVELSVTNVIGAEEELATACREILALVEIHGYRFDDIGVVARSFDHYRSKLQLVFDRHLVPFTCTVGRPLAREPLVKALLRLASLPVNDFEQSALLDVVASPFYRGRINNIPVVERRPDVWRIAVASLGITKGNEDWSRLRASVTPLILQETAVDQEEDRRGPQIFDREQVTLLAELATGVIHDCELLPRRGSVGTLTAAFVELVHGHFVVSGLTEPESTASDEETTSASVGSLIKDALDRLSELDPLGAELSWEEWTELFRLALEDTALPIEIELHRGVRVLDAMEARGLRMRAVFVLGLNEQLFPRVVREDPFLRDRQRSVLASTLGFAIEEKLAGHEEERLLFEMLCCAASNRLYLSYQRADEEGRVMAPSPFIAVAQRDPRFVAGLERSIPRRVTERFAAQPANQEFLPTRDLAVALLLHGQDAGLLLAHAGQDPALFTHGLTVQEILERDTQELGPFDGMVGMGGGPVPALGRQGLSPTSLERYATCPFQYFAEKRLRLEPVRGRREDHLPAPILGTLLHDVLRVSYEQLMAMHWPDVDLDSSIVRATIADAAAHVFAAHAAVSGIGHALLWMLAQEQVVDLVKRAVASDQEDYRTTGYRPRMFETEVEGSVQLEDGSAALLLRGKLDRIDVRVNPPGVRIIDYKFKQSGDMKPEDRNLALGAAKGFRLQPPLYASMRLPSLPPPEEVQFLYLAPRWEQPVMRSVFERARLSGKTGEVIKQTIHLLVQGMTRQEFFILPDSYCGQCIFPAACRRYDTTAWWRSYRSSQARVLRRLRKVQVSDE